MVMGAGNQTIGLPAKLKSSIESLSGVNMDDVRVHYNSSKPAQLSAEAYAQGTDIHIGPGREKHLAHEAWHVVQQKQGRVKPVTSPNATPIQMSTPGADDAQFSRNQAQNKVIVHDAELEKEASQMAKKLENSIVQ